MEAVRITREMREKTNGQYPKYIIWENVAGAFSSNKGEDFRRVLEEITQSNISMPKSGKWATAGMVGNEGPGGAFSVPHGDCLTLNFGECPNVENVSTLSMILEMDVPDKYFLSAKACWGIIRRAEQRNKEIPVILKIALLERIAEEASPTLMSQHRPAVVYGYTQSGYGEFKEGVGTLKKSRGAAGGGSETLAVIMERIAAAVKYRVRRLTPLECERLDGFPDEWTRYGASGKEMSDNARYMALGNSIAVPCAERVFIGIKKAESEE